MSPDKNTPQGLCVDYFDGRRAKPLTSTLRREGDQAVLTTPEGELRLPWQDIEWPERTRHGGRTAHLASGGSLHSADGPAWDAWLRRWLRLGWNCATGRRKGTQALQSSQFGR